MPGVQVSLIMGIQMSYMVYMFWAVFKKKIFSSFFFGLVEVISELSIFFFLIIGTLITFIGREGMSENFSTMIQITAILLVLFATVLNLIYSLVMMVKSLLGMRNLLKYKNMRKAITKNYEDYKKL